MNPFDSHLRSSSLGITCSKHMAVCSWAYASSNFVSVIHCYETIFALKLCLSFDLWWKYLSHQILVLIFLFFLFFWRLFFLFYLGLRKSPRSVRLGLPSSLLLTLLLSGVHHLLIVLGLLGLLLGIILLVLLKIGTLGHLHTPLIIIHILIRIGSSRYPSLHRSCLLCH